MNLEITSQKQHYLDFDAPNTLAKEFYKNPTELKSIPE